jgi:hypothetical protein
MVTGAKNDVEDANTTVKGSKGRACSLAALTDTQGQNATHHHQSLSQDLL